MNGAELIVTTAAKAGIQICFANPGTTELPLVHALDAVPGIRPVLGLFEGVCTGAADGYGRMADRPAMTLLHLGPGLANGLANLHNARRAGTPILNVVGEHATWHRAADPPLRMDIESLIGTVCGWQRTCESPSDLSTDISEACAATSAGKIAGLIVPHDFQFIDCGDEVLESPQQFFDSVERESIEAAARLLMDGPKALIFLGGRALRKKGLVAAARIRDATGCDLLSETLPAHIERGLGIPSVERHAYFPEHAAAMLAKYETVVLAGAPEPVAFFGYPGMSSRLLNESQRVIRIASGNQDPSEALECLADALQAPVNPISHANRSGKHDLEGLPKGNLTAVKACMILAALQPENAIIVDESVTSGGAYYPLAATSPPHSLLCLTGGAIGQGMPCAVGAAMACPDRPVINFQADGSAMYTVQALWTQARESLNVTTLICSNRRYDILRIEFMRAGDVSPGAAALALTDVGNPELDWVKISEGMGVPAVAVDDAEQLAEKLRAALAEPGPHLIEMAL